MNSFLFALLYFVIFLIGASVFSFLNVVVYRLPRKMNYVSGHSVCPNCENKLKWYQLIPIFSYIFLGGKCGFCKNKISFRYTLMEILGGVFALGSFLWYVDLFNLDFYALLRSILVFALLGVLTTIAFIDGDTMEIPNGLVIFVAVFGILSYFLFPEIGIMDRIIGIFSVSVPFLLLTLAIDGAFGGGDIKLMAACGLFLGWKLSLVALFFALLTGGAYGIYLLISKKKDRKDHFAFGPFLCVGVALSQFFGQIVLNWYLGFFNF